MIKRDKIIIEKILKEAAFIASMLFHFNLPNFIANEEKQRATVMTLINIGELIKNLTDDFKKQHKEIPWKSMAGLRDVAAHGYFTLRMEEIWVYATDDLPKVITQIKRIVESKEGQTP